MSSENGADRVRSSSSFAESLKKSNHLQKYSIFMNFFSYKNQSFMLKSKMVFNQFLWILLNLKIIFQSSKLFYCILWLRFGLDKFLQ